MRKRISDDTGILLENILYTELAIGAALAFLLLLAIQPSAAWAPPAVVGIWAIFVLPDRLRCKSVVLGPNSIFVSNRRTTIEIQFSEIEYVTEIVAPPGKFPYTFTTLFVSIKLKHKTVFGDKVLFRPYTRGFFEVGTHPTVVELRYMINPDG